MPRDEDEAPAWVAEFKIQKDTVKSLSSDPELSLIQLMILVDLATSQDGKGGSTPSDICKDFDLDMAQVSKHLRNLRDGGYVHPVADEKDARSKRYYNTLKGSDAAAAHLRRSGHNLEGKDLPHVAVKPVAVRGT